MSKFELDWCHHAKRRMSALTVVEDLEVFEEGGGEFDPRVPALPVQQFDLDPAPKRLHQGVVVAIADRPHRGEEPRVDHPLSECPRRVLTEFNRS